jgi:2-methylcitrate dehydratase PrpD
VTTRFGEPWHVRDVLPKLNPSCFGTHAAIACAAQVRPEVGDAEVRHVELTVPPVLLNVCAIPAPRTGLEGKFSLAYTTAATLLRGEVTVASFTDEAVRAEPATTLASRVGLVLDDTLAKTATRLRVDLADGRVLHAEHDAARRLWVADPEEVRPRVEGKFAELAAGLPGRVELVELLRAPDRIASVDALATLLAGGG